MKHDLGEHPGWVRWLATLTPGQATAVGITVIVLAVAFGIALAVLW